MMKHIYWRTTLIGLMVLFSGQVISQETELGQYQLFKSKTYVKNPLDLRDPFKRKINKKKNSLSKSEKILSGKYSNFSQNLEELSIGSVQVIGVVIGAERRAMIRASTSDGKGEPSVYYLKEGMKVGSNNAEVKAIMPGGIVLVEKIRNVYDLEEYIETVIPISD